VPGPRLELNSQTSPRAPSTSRVHFGICSSWNGHVSLQGRQSTVRRPRGNHRREDLKVG
jgi:hypothetical protein